MRVFLDLKGVALHGDGSAGRSFNFNGHPCGCTYTVSGLKRGWTTDRGSGNTIVYAGTFPKLPIQYQMLLNFYICQSKSILLNRMWRCFLLNVHKSACWFLNHYFDVVCLVFVSCTFLMNDRGIHRNLSRWHQYLYAPDSSKAINIYATEVTFHVLNLKWFKRFLFQSRSLLVQMKSIKWFRMLVHAKSLEYNDWIRASLLPLIQSRWGKIEHTQMVSLF